MHTINSAPFDLFIVQVSLSIEWEGTGTTIDLVTTDRDEAIERANTLSANMPLGYYDDGNVHVLGTTNGIAMSPVVLYVAKLVRIKADDVGQLLDIAAGELNVERDAASNDNRLAEAFLAQEQALSKRSRLVGNIHQPLSKSV